MKAFNVSSAVLAILSALTLPSASYARDDVYRHPHSGYVVVGRVVEDRYPPALLIDGLLALGSMPIVGTKRHHHHDIRPSYERRSEHWYRDRELHRREWTTPYNRDFEHSGRYPGEHRHTR